jgi:septal ring-binding cell division protein DamX
MVLVGTLLALLAAALILALVELSGDPQPVAKAPAGAPTPAPTAGAPPDDGGTAAPPVAGTTPAPSPTAEPSATPGVTPTPDAASTTGGLAEWPEGERAWTVVLASTRSRSEAETKARAAAGEEAGVLRSDDYTSLRKGYWVVFSGQYDSRDAAEDAAEGAAGDAYARRVVPR